MARSPLWPALFGAMSVLVLFGVAGLCVVETGAFDTRASTPHDFVTAWATHTTMIHSAENRSASISAPTAFTPVEVTAGFQDYDQACVSCHGGPAVARAPWVSGLNPSPPYLIDAPRRWSAAQLFWIVKNGVKMTAMPAWGATRTDGQIWDIVAFLEAQPNLSPQDYGRMRAASHVAPP